MKQNDDIKPAVEQLNLTQTQSKTENTRAESVQGHTDEDMNSEYDSAKGNGKNEYEGDGGSNRKKKPADPDGKVVIKGQNVRFDIKI